MFSYYSLILNKCKAISSKSIYPYNIGIISFMQLVNLKKNKFINNHNEKVYNYTNQEVNLDNIVVDKSINLDPPVIERQHAFSNKIITNQNYYQ